MRYTHDTDRSHPRSRRHADVTLELLLEAGDLAVATHLIDLKRSGEDCTEDDSAWIKGYFDTHHPEGRGRELAIAYPLEADEWFTEMEGGLR